MRQRDYDVLYRNQQRLQQEVDKLNERLNYLQHVQYEVDLQNIFNRLTNIERAVSK